MRDALTFDTPIFKYSLHFKNRKTYVINDSGAGKTMLYNALEERVLAGLDSDISCFNYKSAELFSSAIKKLRNRFIVIDNADIVITPSIAQIINSDNDNAYLIFIHNYAVLNVCRNNIACLTNHDNVISLFYPGG